MVKIGSRIKLFLSEAAISGQAEAVAMILCLATSVWLLVDPPALRYLPYAPVLAGVGIGVCLSLMASFGARIIFPRSHSKGTMAGRMATAWKGPFDILAKHDLRAHYYIPAAGVEDAELADALRRLASTGYMITDLTGTQLFGKVASIPMTANETAEMRRAEFRVVK